MPSAKPLTVKTLMQAKRLAKQAGYRAFKRALLGNSCFLLPGFWWWRPLV